MESRITGVAAKADERQHNAEREKERERNSGGKKKISATGWGPASAQPARPHRPAICPAVLSVFQTLPSANIWITSHPYGKGGEGGRQANTNLILLSSPFLIAQDLRRVIITGEGDPLLWSTISEGIDNWTGGGKNFCFKDADACTGPYLISLWDLLTSRGSVMFLTPEQGEGKTERGGGGGEEGKDGGEASPSLLLKCYRRLCPFHWRGILSLSPLLFCFSSHLNSGKPEGYRQRAKHSGFMHICTHSHKRTHTHRLAAHPGAPTPLVFFHPPSPSLSFPVPLWCPVFTFMTTRECVDCDTCRTGEGEKWEEKSSSFKERFLENWGYHIHLVSRCEVLEGSVQTSKAAKYTHRHRSTDNLLGLALTRRLGLNAYSYRCCEEREAGAKQVKRKATEKDTWRKTSGKRWSSRSSPRAESTGKSASHTYSLTLMSLTLILWQKNRSGRDVCGATDRHKIGGKLGASESVDTLHGCRNTMISEEFPWEKAPVCCWQKQSSQLLL